MRNLLNLLFTIFLLCSLNSLSARIIIPEAETRTRFYEFKASTPASTVGYPLMFVGAFARGDIFPELSPEERADNVIHLITTGEGIGGISDIPPTEEQKLNMDSAIVYCASNKSVPWSSSLQTPRTHAEIIFNRLYLASSYFYSNPRYYATGLSYKDSCTLVKSPAFGPIDWSQIALTKEIDDKSPIVYSYGFNQYFNTKILHYLGVDAIKYERKLKSPRLQPINVLRDISDWSYRVLGITIFDTTVSKYAELAVRLLYLWWEEAETYRAKILAHSPMCEFRGFRCTSELYDYKACRCTSMSYMDVVKPFISLKAVYQDRFLELLDKLSATKDDGELWRILNPAIWRADIFKTTIFDQNSEVSKFDALEPVITRGGYEKLQDIRNRLPSQSLRKTLDGLLKRHNGKDLDQRDANGALFSHQYATLD